MTNEFDPFFLFKWKNVFYLDFLCFCWLMFIKWSNKRNVTKNKTFCLKKKKNQIRPKWLFFFFLFVLIYLLFFQKYKYYHVIYVSILWIKSLFFLPDFYHVVCFIYIYIYIHKVTDYYQTYLAKLVWLLGALLMSYVLCSNSINGGAQPSPDVV